MKTINLTWRKIPKHIREKLLKNVYCTKCMKAVEIIDYTFEEVDYGLLIHGKCNVCNNDVTRVVEKE